VLTEASSRVRHIETAILAADAAYRAFELSQGLLDRCQACRNADERGELLHQAIAAHAAALAQRDRASRALAAFMKRRRR
jgi:hypothetical protein